MVSRLAVVGSGLIGTSIALLAAEACAQVFVSDSDEAHQLVAVQRSGGQVWHGQEVDLIVVAVPPTAALATLLTLAATYPNTPITDVTSVKAQICAGMSIAGHESFIGGHPLAGTEHSGPHAADTTLFRDRPWVLADTAGVTETAQQAVQWLVAAAGATPVWMSPREHDDTVAITSHVPQVCSSAVAAQLTALESAQLQVSGPGLASVTRLAASNSSLWHDILMLNAGPVAAALRAVSADLAAVAAALESDESEPVLDLLHRGVAGRAALTACQLGERVRGEGSSVGTTD